MNLNTIKPNYNNQKGVALLMVLVVLLGMTILGLAATDSTNLQSLMVRNNQFRMETFNASNVELDGQVDYYRSAPVGTISPPVSALLNLPIGSQLVADPSDNDALLVERAINSDFDKSITLTRNSGCPNPGNSIGFGKKGVVCTLMRVDSTAQLPNTNVRSDQVQTFSIKSF